jgi:dethiobiotin synthetase/malonyl-CoA O-methyltransferase
MSLLDHRAFVVGTDTNVGKTLIAAALTYAWQARYFKPVQSGTLESDDTETVARLLSLPPQRIITPLYRFAAPLSPHEAAREEGVNLSIETFPAHAPEGPLVVEGAGGVLSPVAEDAAVLDMALRWRLPVVLVARSGLGTINHTLLSIEALKARGVPLLMVVLNGPAQPETARYLRERVGAPLIEIPQYAALTKAAVEDAAGRLVL